MEEQSKGISELEVIPKIKFGFSLQSINLNLFLHFVDRCYSLKEEKKIELDFDDINWEQLFINSQEQSKFTRDKVNNEVVNAVTLGGKSLL